MSLLRTAALQHPSATSAAITLNNTGSADVVAATINSGPLAGTRNRIINGGMAIDQRNAGAAQTITAGAALAYSVDRFYAYSTGANVTGQQVQGASAGQFRYRFTGAASVTGVGFGQRIEQLNSADLAGATATLSVDLANSLLTAVTWTAYYANTANTFGTLASPTRTLIATGTFTVSSTVTRYSANINIPADATTGIEIVLSVGAQTSGTWTIGNVQLEPGNVATPFEQRSYGQELTLCQRYFESSFTDGIAPGTDSLAVASTGGYMTYADGGSVTLFAVRKRATPMINVYSPLTTSCANKVRQASSGTILNVASTTSTQTSFNMSVASGVSATTYQFGWTATAEL